jgi:hypothetical protein
MDGPYPILHSFSVNVTVPFYDIPRRPEAFGSRVFQCDGRGVSWSHPICDFQPSAMVPVEEDAPKTRAVNVLGPATRAKSRESFYSISGNLGNFRIYPDLTFRKRIFVRRPAHGLQDNAL